MPEQQQLGPYVILEQKPVSEKSDGGIFLLRPQTQDRIGKVLSAPEGSILSPGDHVLYPVKAAHIIDEKSRQVGISEENIFCKIETAV
jgi:hypothetical protein